MVARNRLGATPGPFSPAAGGLMPLILPNHALSGLSNAAQASANGQREPLNPSGILPRRHAHPVLHASSRRVEEFLLDAAGAGAAGAPDSPGLRASGQTGRRTA